jgi:hypothetical protein
MNLFGGRLEFIFIPSKAIQDKMNLILTFKLEKKMNKLHYRLLISGKII